MQGARALQRDLVITNASANGYGTAINVTDFRNAVFEISTSGNFSGVIKFQGAVGIGQETGQTAPTFSSAASQANPWIFTQTVDLSNGTAYNGSTGITYSGTDAVFLVEANVNLIDWVDVQVSGYAAGNVWVRLVSADNQ